MNGRVPFEIDAEVRDGTVWMPAAELVRFMRYYSEQLEKTPPAALLQWTAREAIESVGMYLSSEASHFEAVIATFPLSPCPGKTEPASRLPSGEWRCVAGNRTEPCGDCGGCREVQAENAARP